MNALLEQGCSFDGKLTFEGTVQINGHFTGEIFSEGTLVVGEGALIEARVDVGSIVIKGKVQGEIVANDRIEMHHGAEVRGNITARTLVVEEGVIFDGNCQMGMGNEGNLLTSLNANDKNESDLGLESFG